LHQEKSGNPEGEALALEPHSSKLSDATVFFKNDEKKGQGAIKKVGIEIGILRFVVNHLGRQSYLYT
jgi:hypothetical protein